MTVSVSRRSFLRSGVACAVVTGAVLSNPLAALGQAGAGTVSALGFEVPYEAAKSPVFYFTRATFEPYVGGIFVTSGVGGRKVELQLAAVRDYAPPRGARLTTGPDRHTDCFSLLFRAAAPLNQLTSIHTIRHAALGKFDLFLTEREVDGVRFCEAVINHLVA